MKKIFSALLAAALCLGLLTGCGSRYIWTNEEGLSFGKDALAYTDFDASALYDENGRMVGINAGGVTLPEGYMALEIPTGEVTLTEEELDERIASMMQSYAEPEQITDREVADGDTVNIDYVGTVDGVAFQGGNTQGMGTDVTIGVTNYIDDFLQQLIGHTPGETVRVEVTFPDGYGTSQDADGNEMVLDNKDAVFETTINYIAGESVVPECTDAWVRENMDGLSSVADMRADMHNYYSNQLKSEYVTNYLIENTTYDKVPQKLLDYWGALLLNMQEQYAANYGATMEEWLSVQGYASPEAFLDANADAVLQNAQDNLLIQALVDDMDAQLTTEEAQEILGSYYDGYVEAYGANYTMAQAYIAYCLGEITDNATLVD